MVTGLSVSEMKKKMTIKKIFFFETIVPTVLIRVIKIQQNNKHLNLQCMFPGHSILLTFAHVFREYN